MPRKPSKKRLEKLPFGDLKWVMNNLTTEQLSDMDKRAYTGDEVIGLVQRLVEDRWQISVKWDDYSGGIQVTAIMPYKNLPNAGYAFSGRSDDILDAMTIVVYKYFVVADGNLSEFEIPQQNLRG